MRACGGTWIAHGSGDADREVVDDKNRVAVPPESPSYALKRVWLTKEEEAGYYYGFSNEALWPLCHIAYTRPVFRESDWEAYRKVNRLFADAILEEVGDRHAFVFVQDYHLALVPSLLRESGRNMIVAQFWHIPWPNPEAFRVCPWQSELLDGLLGNDLLGFHIRYHCNNFLDTVDRTLEARVDRERYEVERKGKRTAVQPFPISVDFAGISRDAQGADVAEEMERFTTNLGLAGQVVGLGLDRIDYTKGIPDRLVAFERFLEKWPAYKGRIVFIQVGVPSRVHIGAYKSLNDEIDGLVEEINWRHGTGHWKPIIYIREHLSQTKLNALRRIARFCIVNSLHDGMNLVAKEYVASRFDEEGVLILSPFTGAARELTAAVLVNPYATDQFARAIQEAVEMPPEERKRRMRKLREIVAENNIYKWAADLVSALARFEFGNGG
ncbi:MAG: trehalose-6-phosphate synthase, partial [Chloroflexi bacterium]|nr:trehalose-6-phosphate synthase [Chloroflexota bacterium]